MTRKLPSWTNLVLIWLCWSVVLSLFQHFVVARYRVARPDEVLGWTARYTGSDVRQKSYAEAAYYPSLYVAWDSGYYLSIAILGYDDRGVQSIQRPDGQNLSVNYAFMPFYPLCIHIVNTMTGMALPRRAAPVAAGVLVSLLGTLGGMLSLHELARQEGGQPLDGLRAAFYLLIFPGSFFLSQVYTEGLFVGLAFGCLALMGRQKWLPASLLACAALLTRLAGLGLWLALAVAMLQQAWPAWRRERLKGSPVLRRTDAWVAALSLLLPLVTFATWYLSPWGQKYMLVESLKYGRQAFDLAGSWNGWGQALAAIGQGNTAHDVYYLLEMAVLGVGLLASLLSLRRRLPVALFSLFIIVSAVTSGAPQGLVRFVLTAPAIYLFYADLGKHAVFDRAWTLVNILWMGTLMSLYSFDFWVG